MTQFGDKTREAASARTVRRRGQSRFCKMHSPEWLKVRVSGEWNFSMPEPKKARN